MTLREFLKYVRDDSVAIKLVKAMPGDVRTTVCYMYKSDNLAWEGYSHLYNREVIWVDTVQLYDDQYVDAYLRICIDGEPKENEHDLV